jgi:hypothetical protein
MIVANLLTCQLLWLLQDLKIQSPGEKPSRRSSSRLPKPSRADWPGCAPERFVRRQRFRLHIILREQMSDVSPHVGIVIGEKDAGRLRPDPRGRRRNCQVKLSGTVGGERRRVNRQPTKRFFNKRPHVTTAGHERARSAEVFLWQVGVAGRDGNCESGSMTFNAPRTSPP